jgi:hypothetical protein
VRRAAGRTRSSRRLSINPAKEKKMESEKLLIPKLNSENYVTWKMQMKLLLTHKDLDSTIEPESRSEEELNGRTEDQKKREAVSQKKALALISLKVEEEFLGVIEDAVDSARKAWIAFEGMFQSITNGRKLMLRQKLATFKMEPGEKAAKYISRAKDLKRELLHAKLDASDIDLAAVCGLSAEFREIRMILEYSTSTITLDKMLPLLLQHESMMERDKTLEEKMSSIAFSGKRISPGRSGKDRERRKILQALSATHVVAEDTNLMCVPQEIPPKQSRRGRRRCQQTNVTTVGRKVTLKTSVGESMEGLRRRRGKSTLLLSQHLKTDSPPTIGSWTAEPLIT